MARPVARRVRRNEKQWRQIVERCERSGLAASDFCRREGLSLTSLQRWRSRLGRAPAAKFVELAPPSMPPVSPAADWAVELDLPGGVRLRLRR